MAAPMEEQPGEKKKTLKLAPAIDFTSPHFDAAVALFSKDIVLPFPHAKPLDNLAVYESWLKKPNKNITTPREGGSETQERKHAQERHSQIKKPSQHIDERKITPTNISTEPINISNAPSSGLRNKLNRNVLTRMDAFQKGPMSFLKKCVENRHVVKVWTRSATEIRGFCVGYLIAFDKYFNLAMMDVDETYRKPVGRDNRIKKCTETLKAASVANTKDVETVLKTSVPDSASGEPKVKENIPAPVDQQDTVNVHGLSIESSVKAMQELDISNRERLETMSRNKTPYETSTDNKTSVVKKKSIAEKDSKCSEHSKDSQENQASKMEQGPKNTDKDVCSDSSDTSDDEQEPHVLKSSNKTDTVDNSCSNETEPHGKHKKGKVLSFDAMKVAEVWCQSVSKDKTKPKLKLKHRHVNQLFVRGDNVVSVSLVYH